MSSDFRLGIRSLLQLATPPHGVAVLLYRHPFGRIYYPLEIHISDELGGVPVDPLKNYFLFSMRLEEADFHRGSEINIRADAPADVLLRHGKLAVYLFDKADLRVRFHVYDFDEDRDIVLAIIDPATSTATPPSNTLLRAAVHFARGWVHVNERLLTPSGSTAEEILESVRKILDDQNPDPPFFPVLHTHVADLRPPTGAMSRTIDTCGSNSLSYNCALWSQCDSLRSAYIDEMFVRAQSSRCFKHSISDNSSILVRAVTEVCDDLVYRVATSSSGAILCARFNVPQELTRIAQERLASHGDNTARDESDWKLVKRGINRLLTPDEFSALVTMWVGRVENDNVAYALPVGFAPGMKSHYLADIAAVYSKLAGKEPLRSSNGRVGISTVRVDGFVEAFWPKTEAIITALINEAAARIDCIENGFPPPFRIEFVENGISISCAEKAIDPVVVPYGSRAFVIFKLLIDAKKQNSWVSHRELKEHVFDDTSLDAKKVGNRVRDITDRPFKKRNLKPPGDALVENVPGQGWMLGKQVHVVSPNADMLKRARVQYQEYMKVAGRNRTNNADDSE